MQISKTPFGLFHLVFQPEGSNANPRPLPKNEDERIVQRFMESNAVVNPFFQMMEAQQPRPSVSLMLTAAQFEALGRISVGDVLEVNISLPAPNDLLSDGT